MSEQKEIADRLTFKKNVEKARTAGAEARANGRSSDTCPYRMGSRGLAVHFRRAWMGGYLAPQVIEPPVTA